MNKQHWKIHFGSSEKFELISGGKLRHGGINNFFRGKFQISSDFTNSTGAGKTKIAESSRPIWAFAFNKGRQLPLCGARSPYYLFSWQYTYYNSPDMWSYCFWVITHVATTTAAVWGRGINWPKYFPLPWNTGAWNSGRRIDETSRQFACCDKRRSLRWFTLIDTLVNTNEILTGTCTFVTWPKLGKDKIKRKWILYVVWNQSEQK